MMSNISYQSDKVIHPLLSPRFTSLVHIASCPRLCCVKVCVTSDPLAREVRVGQKASFPIKWRAITMKAFSEEKHDVCEPFGPFSYLVVWNFPKLEWCDRLPNLEGLPDGLVSLILSHFRRVVLDAVKYNSASI